jgi:hypothetical protein
MLKFYADNSIHLALKLNKKTHCILFCSHNKFFKVATRFNNVLAKDKSLQFGWKKIWQRAFVLFFDDSASACTDLNYMVHQARCYQNIDR